MNTNFDTTDYSTLRYKPLNIFDMTVQNMTFYYIETKKLKQKELYIYSMHIKEHSSVSLESQNKKFQSLRGN